MTTATAPVRLLGGDRTAAVSQRVMAVTFWFLLPLFGLFVLGAGADKLYRHLNNVPAGYPGIYTVDAHNCSQQLCVTRGTFVSSDGGLLATDQLGPYSWTLGQAHKVIYDSSSADVIPLPAHWDPTATVIGMAGALLAIAIWSWCLFHAVRRRLPATDELPRQPPYAVQPVQWAR